MNNDTTIEFQNPAFRDEMTDLIRAHAHTAIRQAILAELDAFLGNHDDADPRLFDALIRQNQDVAKPLTSNWRSQPNLMHFINAVGPGLFGDEYVPLAPQGVESTQEPIELIDFAVI